MSRTLRVQYLLLASAAFLANAQTVLAQSPTVLFGNPGAPVATVALSPDGKHVYAIDQAGTAYGWNAEAISTNNGYPAAEVAQQRASLAGLNDGRTFMTGGHGASIVNNDQQYSLDRYAVGNGNNVSESQSAALPARTNAIALSADGNRLAVGGGSTGSSGSIVVLNATANNMPITIDNDAFNTAAARSALALSPVKSVSAVAWSGDGNLLAVASGRFGRHGDIRVFRVQGAPTLVEHFRSVDRVDCMSFSADGQTLAAGGRSAHIHLYKVDGTLSANDDDAHAAHLGDLSITRGEVLTVGNVAGEAKHVMAVNRDGLIRIWDTEQSQIASALNANVTLNTAAISYDGNYLVAGGHDGNVYLWHIPSLLGIKTDNYETTAEVVSLRRYHSRETCATPNIVLITMDDVGYGDLSIYGQNKFETPNIDDCARDGMRMTNYYAGTSLGNPSRSSLWTGRHAGHNRIRLNDDSTLLAQDVTIAEVLAAAGYSTGCFGQWRMGATGTPGAPERQGFQRMYGYTDRLKAQQIYGQFANADPVVDIFAGGTKRAAAAADGNADNQESVTRNAQRFLRSQHRRPFFLTVNYSLAHADFQLAKNVAADNTRIPIEVDRRFQLPADEADRDSSNPWHQPQAEIDRRYATALRKIDIEIGKVLDELRALDLEDDTIVFITSDNGAFGGNEFDSDMREDLNGGMTVADVRDEIRNEVLPGANPLFLDRNGGLRGYKGSLYEGGIRVPMIVRWPGKIARGRVSGRHHGHFDLLDTMADLVDASVRPAYTDGESMMPLILGKNLDYLRPRVMYFQLNSSDGNGGEPQLRVEAIRNGRWKVIHRVAPADGEPEYEVYDLATNPQEDKNDDLVDVYPQLKQMAQILMDQARQQP